MQRQHIENSSGRQTAGRRNSGRRSARRGADKPSHDKLFLTVFDDVPLDVSTEDLKAYEKLLHNDLWFDDDVGASSASASNKSTNSFGNTAAAAKRKSQIWIESEAVLAELRRQALEGAESADWEETRKLNLSRHQLAAALEQRSEESVLGEYLRDLSNVARVRMSRAAVAVRPFIDSARETNVKLFSRLAHIIKGYSQRTLQYLLARALKPGSRKREVAGDDMQVVRTSSFPPPPLANRRFRLGNYGIMIVVVAAFVLAVTMIFSTPAPQQDFHASAVKANFSKGTATSLSRNAGIASFLHRTDSLDEKADTPSRLTRKSSEPASATSASGNTGAAAASGQRKLVLSDATGATATSVTANDARATAPGAVAATTANTGQRPVSAAPEQTPVLASASAPASAPVPVAGPTVAISGTGPGAAAPATALPQVPTTAAPGISVPAQNQSPFRSGPTLPGANLQPAQPAAPFVPSRAAVKNGMQRVAPLVAKCRTNQSGQIIMKIVISGATGQVLSSKVLDDTFSGTPTGICAMHAVKNARFQTFQKETLVIRYPFEI